MRGHILFYSIDHSFERLRVIEGEVSESFAVKFDVFSLKQVDKTGIRETLLAAGSVDTHDPHTVVFALFKAAVFVSEPKAFFNGGFGNGKNVLTCTKITFG